MDIPKIEIGIKFTKGDKEWEITGILNGIVVGKNVTKSGYGCYNFNTSANDFFGSFTTSVERGKERQEKLAQLAPKVLDESDFFKIRLDDYEQNFNQSFINELADFLELKFPGRYFESRISDGTAEKAKAIVESYYGESKPLTPWQRTARNKILEYYKDKDSEYHFSRKDEIGVYFTDQNLSIGTLKEVNSDLIPLGIKVIKQIGRRYYFEKA